MQASKGKAVAKVIAYLLVLLIVITVIGLVYRFTNGFNEDFKTFYVEYDGKQILTTDSKMTLQTGKTYRFDVKYTFDGGSSEPKDYNVKVIPNVERDFDFTVDGERYLYSKENDLTAGFGFKKSESYFELTLKNDCNLQSVLESVYPDKTVEVSKEALKGNTYPYKLVVSSYNDNVTYNIRLNLLIKVTGVELDQEQIIFSPVSENDEAMGVAYSIDYDTLGSGSMRSIAFHCQETAVAGERVAFTIEVLDLSDEYEDYSPVEVSNVLLQDNDTGEEVEGLEESNGVYSFVMPECDVTVMVYLMPI